MKKSLLFVFMALLLVACTQTRKAEINVIPMPLEYTLSDKTFKFDNNSKLAIIAPEESKKALSEYIATTALSLTGCDDAKENILLLQIVDTVPGVTSAEGYSMTTDRKAWRKLALSWGVTPMLSEKFNSVDVMFYKAKECAQKALHLSPGDNIVLTAGPINGEYGNTNTIKVEKI